MNTTSEVVSELQKALANSEKAHQALEAAQAKLAPLELAAKEADNAVAALMNQYRTATGLDEPKRRGRRAAGDPKRVYNIPPETKIAAAEKRAHTRAKNAGKSDSEAKKAGKEAAAALKAKLGV